MSTTATSTSATSTSPTTSIGGPTLSDLRWAEWAAIGTTVRLVVTDPAQLESARAMLADDLAALDAACSRFRDDSELIRLEARAGRPTTVSALLAGAVRAAMRGALLTDGLVDPTVGRTMEAIGYDRDFASVPAQNGAVRVSVSHVPRWRQIHLDAATNLLTVPDGVRVDLGATAKAWAADRSAEGIARVLGCGTLVSLGGDIAVAGEVPPGGWSIRVQDITGDPLTPAGGPADVITIRDGGLATSSTSARRWQRGGDLMHHILDPRTGRPADSDWRTVSVAAGSALDANIASTASIIRGKSAAGWLATLGLPARLVAVDGSVTRIAGWPESS
ncbi:MAG: FAD:protein FMN transferase [Actinomycetota bacterium]